MNRAGSAVLIALLAVGCGSGPYPGYKKVNGSVYLRLITLGEGQALVADGDSVLMRFRAARFGEAPGSLFSTDRRYAVADLRTKALITVLERMHEGDSMSVIVPACELPWGVIAAGQVDPPPDTMLLQVELALQQIRSPQMQRTERDRLRHADPIGFETRMIERHLELHGEQWSRWGSSNIYYHIQGAATDTLRVAPGSSVTITYSGRRLEDGQVFDDTHRNGHPFTFRFGDHDQVVKGLETAVHLLREGQHGTFIIPSAMAFGERGIQGIIDPFTPVVYEVVLERVERSALVTRPDR